MEGLTYDLSQLDRIGDGTGRYVTVSATDSEGHTVSITVNNAGQGRFHRVETRSSAWYEQDLGTLQYSLPDTDRGIISQLDRLYAISGEKFASDDEADRLRTFIARVSEVAEKAGMIVNDDIEFSEEDGGWCAVDGKVIKTYTPFGLTDPDATVDEVVEAYWIKWGR